MRISQEKSRIERAWGDYHPATLRCYRQGTPKDLPMPLAETLGTEDKGVGAAA